MSIGLKTDIRRLLDANMHYSREILKHNALAAHAMQMAIEEFRTDTLEDFYTADQIVNYIKSRAAVNLARLLGEGV